MGSTPPVQGAAALPVITARQNDTLKGLAARIYKDERVVEVLAAVNPGVTREGSLVVDETIRKGGPQITQD